MSKTDLDIHSSDKVQLYGAFVGGDDPGCQDYTKLIQLRGVRIVDEKWLLNMVALRDELVEALTQCRSVLNTAYHDVTDEVGRQVIARRVEAASAIIAKAKGGAA